MNEKPMDPACKAATDLIDHYGKAALAIARERAKAFTRGGASPDSDVALRILSLVERRFSKEGIG